jgi:hypothetical protein
MTFKFVAKNLQTGMTGSVTVRADRESIARQKLQLSGYEVVRLVRVSNGQEHSLKVTLPSAVSVPAPRLVRRPSRSLQLKIKLGAIVHEILAPFSLFN